MKWHFQLRQRVCCVCMFPALDAFTFSQLDVLDGSVLVQSVVAGCQ